MQSSSDETLKSISSDHFSLVASWAETVSIRKLLSIRLGLDSPEDLTILLLHVWNFITQITFLTLIVN